MADNKEKTDWMVENLAVKRSFAESNRRLADKKSALVKGKKSLTDKIFILFCLSAFFVNGCTTNYAPVEQRSATPYSVKNRHIGKTPNYHLVKKGDTLYSIAWIYGLDFKSLAYKNRIKPPYHIYIGDKLRLTQAYPNNKTKVKQVKSRQTSYSKTNYKKNAVRTSPASYKTRSSAKTKSTSNTKRAVDSNKKTATYTGSKRLKWNWPVKGKIIQRYSPGSGKKGIDISASKGTLIKSAEAGKVVYSGQGLVGYGKLIIIKHNETYLSAYAHNQSLLVNEGQLVRKGQNIAQLGRSGTDRYKLHFEIRKNGKPVDPMSYLPR